MPRKKNDFQNNEPAVIPKRTRKIAPVREKTTSPSSLERPRLMSDSEKRQLILAHAANRRPVDAVQRFSLWTGVIICVLAIGVGWIYTMRQTIIGALETDAATPIENQDINYEKLRESVHGSINAIVNKIDVLQEKEIQELQRQAIIVKSLNATAENIASDTDMVTLPSGSPDIFRPEEPTSQTDINNKFQFPQGVKIETSN